MKIKLLGPLEVWEHGISITPTRKKLRQLVALLAVHAGQIVTVPVIIEELWDVNAPRSVVQTLQTYIMQIRQLIDAALPDAGAGAAKEVLITHPGGYCLNLAGHDIDLHGYNELADAGHRALELGDYESASRLLHRALDTWRGPVLVDVQTGSQLAIQVARLEQSRLCVQESRIEADLRLGRHRHVLGELAELTARYPMHETLCAQYMTALYSSGLKWRALDIFQTLRRTLVQELGVEPSLHMQKLQRAILSADVELRIPFQLDGERDRIGPLERQVAAAVPERWSAHA